MNISRFRLITFDVTDTLLKFRKAPGKQYCEVGALYGVSVDSGALSANFKQEWRKMNAEHPNFGRHSGLGWRTWWKEIVKGTFKASNPHLDEKKLDSVSSYLIQLYESSMCWQQSHGALGLLSYLRNRGIPLGVISNFDPRLETTLINTKLRHYFQFVTASYEAGIAKPSLGIFEKAMEMSNVERIKPEECLHVGNSEVLDYQGARNCGWNAVLIRDGVDVRKAGDDADESFIFSSLYDLHRHFLEHNREELSERSL